jgi:protein-disulfide isomerase
MSLRFALVPLISLALIVAAGCSPSDKQIQAWVEKNPELIIKSLQGFQRKQQEDSQPKPEMVKEFSKELFENAGSPSVGTGKVKIAYFFDFNCGHCTKQGETINDLLKSANGKDVTIIYKNFPILAPSSETAAKAALAANLQGKYKEFYDQLYKPENHGRDEATLEKVAKALKLDMTKWKADMDGTAVKAELDHVRDLATKMKISGTPLLAISPDQIFPGRVDQLLEIVQKTLK